MNARVFANSIALALITILMPALARRHRSVSCVTRPARSCRASLWKRRVPR